MKIKYMFSMLFIVFSILIYILASYEKRSKISSFTKAKSLEKMQNYNSLYSKYQVVGNVVFDTKINTQNILEIFKDAKDSNDAEKVIIRKKLYDELTDVYKILKTVNIKQLHFHLPNNDSFLRFHKPAKFGDNLTSVRETIKYVNENKLPVDGFEEGRIYNGYRFVFPLILNEEHLGSVEVSFSGIAISSDFMKNYNQFATLLISEDIINEKVFENEQSNYAKSSIEGFHYEKKQLKYLESNSKFILPTDFSNEFQTTLKNYIQSKEDVFTIFDYKLEQLFTFIKLKNPITHKNVALFMISGDASYIPNKTKNFYILLLLGNLLLFFIIYIIYKEVSYSKKTKKINAQLEDSLEIIKQSQDQLVESEKMAALGALVSGVAHEVNTPLGNAVTASTIIKTECNDLLSMVNDGTLKKSTLVQNVEHISESAKLLYSNLDTAANLIKSFKKISVDQSHEASRQFDLAEYINEIFLTFKSQLKQVPVETQIICEENIIIDSYPGVFAQIFNNFIQNSILHGFETKKENAQIIVNIFKDKESLHIVYKDNGSGVDEKIRNKIFDPFVTTKRNAGGTGIGLNIVYNLITQKLMGSLEFESELDKGIMFRIILPVNYSTIT